MRRHDWNVLLEDATSQALGFLNGLPERAITSSASLEELRSGLGGSLPESPSDAKRVVAELARAAERGLVATTSGRYFGYVIGGALPASIGAEWLTAAWGQCGGFHALSPWGAGGGR